jgi:hypothetical protein
VLKLRVETRIYLAATPVDMRSFDGLCAIVPEILKLKQPSHVSLDQKNHFAMNVGDWRK